MLVKKNYLCYYLQLAMKLENKGIQIKEVLTYPNQLDSFSKKNTPEWGKMMAQAIQYEWFYNLNVQGYMCKFYTSRLELMERRLYAKGQISMAKYLPMLGTNGDTSLLNLSKKSISRIPKLVDVVVNGMVNRNYSIRATAIDQVSQDNQMAYRRQLENDMNSIDIIQKSKETFGIDIGSMPTDKIPETKQELDIHLQMEYKPSIELSEELAISVSMEENMYRQTIDKQVKIDLVVCGIAWVRNRFNASKGIMLEYVDPVNKVHSYTKDPYFRDCFYHGEFKTVLISDVLVEYPWLNDVENADLKNQLTYSADNWWAYQKIPPNQQIKGTTNLLYFTYKTFKDNPKKIKEKATGEKIVTDALENFDETKLKKGQTNDFKRVSVVEEILFEGVYVLGTDILLKWEVSKNMGRPKSNKQKVVEQYIGIAPNYQDGYIDSLVARMIPVDDKLNILELKAEQIIQGITPDGIAIDTDALAELDLGEGKAPMTAFDQYNMWLQKGSFFYRSYGASGDYNNAQKPFTEIKTGDSINKLQALRNESLGYLNTLTDIIGLNKASDASTPDKDSLVGIQKLAALNSNLATRHILDGGSYITLKSAEAVSYRIADILQYFPELRKDLIRKIGATSVQDLEYVKDLHLSDFAIYLDLEADDEEKAELNRDLSDAMSKGFIGISDKFKILNIPNFKLAVQYLSILIDKRDKKQQEAKTQEFKVQADENIRAAQGAEQAKQQTAQLIGRIDAQTAKVQGDTMIAKVQAEGDETRKSLQVEWALRNDNTRLVNEGMLKKNDLIEDNKDARIDKQSTAQSEMIKQRHSEGEPIDFEAKNANMKMFELTDE
jgi:hypothetical protein